LFCMKLRRCTLYCEWIPGSPTSQSQGEWWSWVELTLRPTTLARAGGPMSNGEETPSDLTPREFFEVAVHQRPGTSRWCTQTLLSGGVTGAM